MTANRPGFVIAAAQAKYTVPFAVLVSALEKNPMARQIDGNICYSMAKGFVMTQTTNRLFDEIGKIMTDAAGAAQGARREVEAVMRAQAERILNDLDVVQRDEFEAVRAMAVKAREENAALEQRLAALELKLAARPKPASGRSAKKTGGTRSARK